MTTIKEATERAIAFAQDTLGPERVKDVRLEEIESGVEATQEVWRITLSMPSLDRDLGLAALRSPRRDYKVFAIDKCNGQVVSMKIREVANS